MSTQRYISTSFWDDPWVNDLDPSEKFVYLYLLTNTLTNIAGIYEITDKRICFDTGYNTETVRKILKRFHDAKKACRYNHYIILPSWPKHQKWDKSPKIKAGIDSILNKLPEKLLEYTLSIGYQYPLNYINTDLDINTDKDIDIDIEVKTDSVMVDFENFYNHFGNKQQRPRALSAYKKARKNKTFPDQETLFAIIDNWKLTDKWKDGYQPYPSSWLNGEGWLDELPKIVFNSDTLKTIEEQTAFRWFKRDNNREPTSQEFCNYYNSEDVKRKLTR